jgi:hypothetical protein
MTSITFWTENEDGTSDSIYSIENVSFNPFKIGTTFYLSVSDIYPSTEKQIIKEEPRMAQFIINFRKERNEKYHIKHYKIVSEYISLHQN